MGLGLTNIWWMYCTSVRCVMQSPQRRHQWLPSATSVINSKSDKKKSLSCQNASLARKWSWCFNGIVVIHGVCGRVASARISCFRASSGLAKHRYWPNRGLHASPRWSQRSYQSLAFLYESLWEESQGSPLHSVWKWAPSSLSSRSQASAKIRVHEEKRTSPEMDQKCHKSTWISLGT